MMRSNRLSHDMTHGPEWKLILLFAIPVMLGNLLQQLYSAADGIIVGRFVGEAALSAIGTTQSLVFLCTSFAIGMGVGSSVVTSQYFGADRKDEIPLVVDTALILMGVLGIVISVAAITFARIFLQGLMNVPADILDASLLYFRIYAAAIVFTFIYNGIAAILRGMGDSKATLYFLLVSTVLNVVLDLLFVAVLDWGVAGAAIATSIAQTVCAIVSFVYLRRKISANQGKRFDMGTCKLIMRLGIPAAIQHSIVSLGHIAMQRLVNGFGQVSIAAYTVGNRIDSFIMVPIQGMSTALSSFTGQNIGAGHLDRTKRGLRSTVVICVGIALVLCVVLRTFAAPIVGFFSLEGPALARGIEQVRFMMIFFWIFAAYMTIGGVFQGAGDVITQSAITLMTLAIRVILGYIGVGTGVLGYEVAWVTMPIGWAAALVVSLVRYFTGGWKKKAIAGKLAKEENN